MIINPDEVKSDLACDLCIVGGGPLAITIALKLASTGKKIIVLAGGGWNETAVNQDLNRGIVNPAGSHEPLEENRRRQFGGATTVWGGRCIPFDPIDFEERAWIPYSGWPFSYKELEPFYVKAMELCQAGEFEFSAGKVFGSGKPEIIPGLDTDDIRSDKLERWSTPVNFAREYREALSSSTNINVILDAHVIKIETRENKKNISGIIVNINGTEFSCKAGKYVLAVGGIETPRLLLASKNNFYPDGIGNDYDVVGRYYMGHLIGIYASVAPRDRKAMIFDFEKDGSGVYCRRRWWITEKAQVNREIGNAIMFLHNAQNQDGHRDALFSSVFLAKSVLSIAKQKSIKKSVRKLRELRPAIKDHFFNVIKNALTLAPQIVNLALKRFSKRRLPFILPSVNSKALGLYFQTEQMPNPDSRITISEKEVDRLGMPRAVAHIAFTDMDVKTVIEAHKIFVTSFDKNKLGEIHFSEKELLEFTKNRMLKFNSAAHHLGTARMSENPKLGVVDSNCKVHGIDNLYIVGGAVFPTGGHANPTLTALALAVRLAENLKSEMK